MCVCDLRVGLVACLAFVSPSILPLEQHCWLHLINQCLLTSAPRSMPRFCPRLTQACAAQWSEYLIGLSWVSWSFSISLLELHVAEGRLQACMVDCVQSCSGPGLDGPLPMPWWCHLDMSAELERAWGALAPVLVSCISVAAAINYYKCSGLKQLRFILLQFWRSHV